MRTMKCSTRGAIEVPRKQRLILIVLQKYLIQALVDTFAFNDMSPVIFESAYSAASRARDYSRGNHRPNVLRNA